MPLRKRNCSTVWFKCLRITTTDSCEVLFWLIDSPKPKIFILQRHICTMEKLEQGRLVFLLDKQIK